MTKAQLVAYVRRMTLASESDLTDAEIESDLDNALLELATFHKWPWLYATGTITLVADQAEYALPSDLWVLEQIVPEGGPGTILRPSSPVEVRSVYGSDIDSGTPVLYYLSGESSVTLVPAPELSLDAEEWTVQYYKIPDLANDFASGDEPPFNAAYHLILADKACQFFWEREEKMDVAMAYEARFYRRANAMLQYYLTRMPAEEWILGGGNASHRLRRTPSWWPES